MLQGQVPASEANSDACSNVNIINVYEVSGGNPVMGCSICSLTGLILNHTEVTTASKLDPLT